MIELVIEMIVVATVLVLAVEVTSKVINSVLTEYSERRTR